MSSDAKLWERMENESAKAHSAFIIYRDLGMDRSLSRVERVLRPGGTGTIGGRLFEWSSKFRWVKRAAAWDAEKDRVRREAQINEIKAMNRRQASYGQAAQNKAMKKLANLSEEQIDALTIFESLAMLEKGCKIERIARGEPSDVVKQESKVERTVVVDEFKDVPIEKLMALDKAWTDVLNSNR